MTKSATRTHETTNMSITVLEAVAELDGAQGTEVADHLDMAVSTVHKHLQTLVANGFLIKRDGTYQLGLRLFHLGSLARQRDKRYELAREKTLELGDRINAEANFSVEENGRAITLFDTFGGDNLEGFQRGEYFYLHNIAAGKAILAEFSRDRIDEILDQWGMPEQTENTIGDRETLFEELDEVRDQGYAVNRQESWEGLYAVAVAVINPNGTVLGAIDISGPPYRLSNEEELAYVLQEAVCELEDDLKSQEQI